ncbi:MAG: 4Fe-4S dicluster domain-containing protein [Acidobacteriota bacterium]
MTIRGLWQVNGGDTVGAVRDLFRMMFDKQVVDALLVPVQGANGSVMPALVKNPTRLDHADPFAPVMAFNSARLVSMLTHDGASAKLGVVLRSCEIRAVVELAKFNQVKLDHVLIIGVDCFGTFAVPDYQPAPDFFARAQRGDDDSVAFRSACAMCERPAPANAAMSIGFIGVDGSKALVVEMQDEIAVQLGVQPDESVTDARAAILAELVNRRTARRDAEFKRFHDDLHAHGGMATYFANCLECTNCMNACPICYCKECFFRTANAEHATAELLHTAQRHGALNMPPDALLFQLTRLNHMATSCVGCGMCEAACPHDIPLTAMFRTVGASVQKIFNYEPGRDINDKPPFMVFQRDELQQIGEA